MGYTAERSRFLGAVSGGAADAGKTSKLNAVVYGGDRWAPLPVLPVALERSQRSRSLCGSSRCQRWKHPVACLTFG